MDSNEKSKNENNNQKKKLITAVHFAENYDYLHL